MKFTLEIDMDSDAFLVCRSGPEIGRILRELAIDLYENSYRYNEEHKIVDENGNTVGTWKIDELKRSS